MIKIAFFGEAMQELSAADTLSFGGDTYNTAVYLKRLIGKQAEVYFISAIGSDKLSLTACSQWKQQGLNLDFLQFSTQHTLGKYGITVADNAQRVFHYERSNSAARAYFSLDVEQRFISGLQQRVFDYVYFSAISLAIYDDHTKQRLIDALTVFRQKGGKVIFDSNYRPALWTDRSSTAHWYRCAYDCSDLIFITNDDHFEVFGVAEPAELVAFYQAYSHELCVIKQGASDTLVVRQSTVTSYPVKVVKNLVDTTAAGDAFAAGFLAEYLQQNPILTAVNTAQQLAAQVICAAGAIVKTTVQTASAIGESS